LSGSFLRCDEVAAGSFSFSFGRTLVGSDVAEPRPVRRETWG